MDKVYLSTLRDIWFNKSRSIVIILSLIMVVAFPISFLNVAPNLTQIIEDEEDTYHLAHYNIFFDTYYDVEIADTVKQAIVERLDVNPNEVFVETRKFEGSKMQATGQGSLSKNSWIDLDVMALDPDNPPFVSALELIDGRYPTNETEIILLNSLAESDGIELNDIVSLYDTNGKVQYQVVGLVKSIEYSSYELSQSGVAFLNLNGFERLTNRPGLSNLTNEISVYFDFDINSETLVDLSEYIKEVITIEGITVVLFWFVRNTSFRRALLDALQLTSQYMTAASIFIFLVAGVVIFVVTNRYITEQKRRIGALHAFGVKRREILLSFFLRIFVLSIISIIFGLILSKFLLGIIVTQLVNQWGLIGFSNSISTDSIIFTLTSSAIVSYLFTFLAVTNLINLTPYEAMRGKQSDLKSRGIMFKLSGLLPTRIIRGAAKNLTRNRTRTILTVTAFTIALTFSGSLLYADQSIGYTIDSFYDETVSFDVEINLGNPINLASSSVIEDIRNRPEVVRSEYFLNNLVQFNNRPDVLTYMVAYQYNTTMYDLSSDNILEGRWYKPNSSEVVISKYVEATVDISIGEQIEFDYLGVPFNMTVVGITNDIMFNTAFMLDFQYINEIIQQVLNPINPDSNIIANKLLLDLHDDVDISEFQNDLNENNRDIDIALTKNSYIQRSLALSESQTAIIYLMVLLGLIVGSVSVFTTLLIAVVERERELALLEVFGYRRSELLLQILIEGWIIGIIALIPSFIAARIVAKDLWMQIVSDNLYQLYPSFPFSVNVLLIIFAFISISLSIIPAFRSATSSELAETIREE